MCCICVPRDSHHALRVLSFDFIVEVVVGRLWCKKVICGGVEPLSGVTARAKCSRLEPVSEVVVGVPRNLVAESEDSGLCSVICCTKCSSASPE